MPHSAAKEVTTVACPSGLATPVASIIEALQGLQFGQLTVIVHDGVVVQIDRTEKRRLAK